MGRKKKGRKGGIAHFSSISGNARQSDDIFENTTIAMNDRFKTF